MRRIYIVLAVAVALVPAAIAAGCGNDDSNDPSVTFIEPKGDATVGPDFTATVKLDNFKIDPAAVGKAPQDKVGHLHFSLDDGKYDTPVYSGANGKLAKQLNVDGQYSPAVMPTITYKDVPPGKHTLKVELANNNHTSTGKSATEQINVE